MGDVLRATIVLLSSLLVPALAQGADCAETRTSSDLMVQLEAAEAAYGQLDVDRFRDAMDQARVILPCLDEELTRHTAAELHRFEGLRAFVDRDPEHSTTAFAAARAIEPHYRFPETLVPAGNPVLEDYEAIDPHSSQVEVLADPIGGRLVLDGRTSNERATSFPTVFQLVLDDGRVSDTAYLWPGDAVPAYEKRAGPRVVVAPPPDPVPGGERGAASVVRRGPDKRFLLGAGGALLASGLLYGGAFVVHKRYDDPTTTIDRLNGIRSTNNTLVLASGATAVVGLGLGTTAFLVADF